KINKKENIFVYFYYPECPACKKMSPDLNKAIKKNNVTVYAINIKSPNNDYDEIVETYGLQMTPTILHFTNAKVKNRIEGLTKIEELNKFFSV
ncbi:thioredoxin family protein, partial [Enterococcus faecalis]|nr:thioredoxin family protein [Enterococcus faecalis]